MFSVKVVWKSTGKPAKGKRVSAAFDAFLRSVTRDQYTDADGNADFDCDPGQGKIFVDGKTVYQGRIEGRVVVYV
jgi:hypothetical protein